MKSYYIYHIPGVKIGVSTEPTRRVNRQGYTEFEILEEHTDIDIVGIREKELQLQYGYKVDTANYKQSREWACSGAVNGGKVAGNNQRENFKKIASKYAKENSIKSRYKVRKKVYQYTLDLILVKIHDGMRIAINDTGIHSGHCLRGLKKTAGGFIWSYTPLV